MSAGPRRQGNCLGAAAIRERLLEVSPGLRVEVARNPGPSGQDSLEVDPGCALEALAILRDDPELQFDFLSNVTGIDWMEGAERRKAVVGEREGEAEGGEIEVVCHFFSIARGCGPAVVRLRTRTREPGASLPSITPLFRSAEFQEREIYDLFGVRFEGHPDLRRLLMWENFSGHPMRRDYVGPDDYEFEPTPHGEALERAAARIEPGQAPEFPAEDLAEDAAPGGVLEDEGGLLAVSLGPQHPSTHGVFRMNAILDGETVVALKPVFGYLHRNHEKLAENMSWLASMPFTDRLDYFCSLTNNWAYALSVEKLAGIEVPERAEYLRVITAELTRLANHISFVGFFLSDMGSWGTVLMYAFRERERILDLFEALTGARMMCNYFRFGGCRCDVPPRWVENAKTLVAGFPRFLDELEALVVHNEILVARTQGLGVLAGGQAVNAGLTGPVLRASGVPYDIRKADGYGIYDRFAFRVPLGETGDCYDRFLVRLFEMRESLRILDQALRELPAGPVIHPKAKLRGFRPPAGEAYGRIEGPKGELGFYLVSAGGPNPYRYRVRPPSLINLTLLEDMCRGTRIADVMVLLGSIDIVLGEVDR